MKAFVYFNSRSRKNGLRRNSSHRFCLRIRYASPLIWTTARYGVTPPRIAGTPTIPSRPTNPISTVAPSEFIETMETNALFKKYACSLFSSGSYRTVHFDNSIGSNACTQFPESVGSAARILFMFSSLISSYFLGFIKPPIRPQEFVQSPFQKSDGQQLY